MFTTKWYTQHGFQNLIIWNKIMLKNAKAAQLHMQASKHQITKSHENLTTKNANNNHLTMKETNFQTLWNNQNTTWHYRNWWINLQRTTQKKMKLMKQQVWIDRSEAKIWCGILTRTTRVGVKSVRNPNPGDAASSIGFYKGAVFRLIDL